MAKYIFLFFFTLSSAHISLGQKSYSNQTIREFNSQSLAVVKATDYYRLHDIEFLNAIVFGLPNVFNQEQYELLQTNMSDEIKQLYDFSSMDFMISSNGGFYSLFDQDKKELVYSGIQLFEKLELLEAKFLLKEVLDFQTTYEKEIEGVGDFFFQDPYMAWNKKYDSLRSEIHKVYENYIRKNSFIYCKNENGNYFTENYSGPVFSYHPNGITAVSFNVSSSKIDGAYKEFNENGKIQFLQSYLDGIKDGTASYFDEGGRLSKTVTPINQEGNHCVEEFYSNGILSQSYTIDKANKMVGEIQNWFSNGNLSSIYRVDDREVIIGDYLEFWEDGSKKLEATFENGQGVYHNYWSKNGDQLLKEGTGKYIQESGDSLYGTSLTENNFLNYQKHGIQTWYFNGVLRSYNEYKNGVPHGLSLVYYKNGKLQKKYLIENGKVVSFNEYGFFDNPIMKKSISFEVSEDFLTKQELPIPSVYPRIINEEEVAEHIQLPLNIFDMVPQDSKEVVRYLVTIGVEGKVIDFKFLVGRSFGLDSEFEDGLKLLEFEPGRIKDKVVVSHGILTVNFFLEESEISAEEVLNN